ncbi:hepatic leukemia factor isoform X2 [Chrysoperla carnea]|uniref:hepatic leukemia factor isoform X2 n=1 Tax=Chrysoperla carnea TaxID=189513 RepID=UPI001D090DA9|nr:hepatic leukemia factor isoform X2 [Chrysoperla carnea]
MSFAIPIKSEPAMMQQRTNQIHHTDFHNPSHQQNGPVPAAIAPTAPITSLPGATTGGNIVANQQQPQHQQIVMPGFGGGLPPHLQTHTNNNGSTNQDDQQSRWSQYQQLWRQHVYGNNKPAHSHGLHSGLKDLAASGLLDDKKDDSDLWGNVEAQTAFLGPNLWDKSYDTDLKYVDLDEFLSENGVSMDGIGSHLGSSGSSGGGGGSGGSSMASHGLPKRERSPSPSDCMSPDTLNPPSPADSSETRFSLCYEWSRDDFECRSALSMASSGRDFDPRTRAFSDEELKPQPMIKKSRKQFVPDDLKDDKYWARRRKNNMAAKRSRDARRMKENQIALRAGYLEKEVSALKNMGLRQEIERLKKENHLLRDKLAKYTDV